MRRNCCNENNGVGHDLSYIISFTTTSCVILCKQVFFLTRAIYPFHVTEEEEIVEDSYCLMGSDWACTRQHLPVTRWMLLHVNSSLDHRGCSTPSQECWFCCTRANHLYNMGTRGSVFSESAIFCDTHALTERVTQTPLFSFVPIACSCADLSNACRQLVHAAFAASCTPKHSWNQCRQHAMGSGGWWEGGFGQKNTLVAERMWVPALG